MIEQRLQEASVSFFPPTPSLAEGIRGRLPATPATAPRRLPRRTLAVALAALALAGTALAASALDLVPGIRIERVDELPELPYLSPIFGEPTTVETLRATIPFQPELPERLGEPDALYLDRDPAGAPVVTAVYGDDLGARALLTQWPARVVLFNKLFDPTVRAEYVDAHGAPGIWIEGGDHAVFYLGRSVTEMYVSGYLTGNVLVWHRGGMSYRLELGGARDEALEIAGSMRPPE
jgi:hypothetical protein